MYLEHFGFREPPFSIAPNPELLFPSKNHQEALAHLHYALTGQGGLLCLTGEVGTGKTTLCRAFLASLPAHVRSAYIFNPYLDAKELLQALCEEFGITVSASSSVRDLYSLLNHEFLAGYARGERFICIIDEAQVMPVPLLEQVRLLTNLETHQEKLLTLILVGQSELKTVLKRYDLRQLNQRITARFHLPKLGFNDTRRYLAYRCHKAGGQNIFGFWVSYLLWRKSQGIPRLLNILADRALLGAYSQNKKQVTSAMIKGAAKEVLPVKSPLWSYALLSVLFVILALQLGLNRHNYFPQEITTSAPIAATENSPVAPPVQRALSAVAKLTVEMNLPIAENCEELSDGWQCLWLDLPLDILKKIQRPIMVQLRSDVQSRWALLMPNTAASLYQRQALVLWQPPVAYDNEPVRPNTVHEVVGWVREKLGMQEQSWQSIAPSSAESSIGNLFYDPLLVQKVVEFQRDRGVPPDRILGPQTLYLLWAREG
jgi:general secretion pathway protein A